MPSHRMFLDPQSDPGFHPDRRVQLILKRKPVSSFGNKGFTGAQDGVREVRMVGAVGPVLGFETEAASERVNETTFSAHIAFKMITAVKLHTGLGGEGLQNAPAF